jgi:hypothetical protein
MTQMHLKLLNLMDHFILMAQSQGSPKVHQRLFQILVSMIHSTLIQNQEDKLQIWDMETEQTLQRIKDQSLAQAIIILPHLRPFQTSQLHLNIPLELEVIAKPQKMNQAQDSMIKKIYLAKILKESTLEEKI